MRLKNTVLLIAFGGMISASWTAFGHANVVPQNNSDDFSGRQFEEGTTAYIKLNLAHACKVGPGGVDRRDTNHFAVVFPNNLDLTGIAATFDKHGGQYAGNALMTIKTSVDSDWKKTLRQRGPVPIYYSHGANSEDTRGVQWQHGNVPDDMYDNVEIRVKARTHAN